MALNRFVHVFYTVIDASQEKLMKELHKELKKKKKKSIKRNITND